MLWALVAWAAALLPWAAPWLRPWHPALRRQQLGLHVWGAMAAPPLYETGSGGGLLQPYMVYANYRTYYYTSLGMCERTSLRWLD